MGLWPFGRSAGSGGGNGDYGVVHPFTDVSDSASFQGLQNATPPERQPAASASPTADPPFKKAEALGHTSGNLSTQMHRNRFLRDHPDTRSLVVDTESIDTLVARYSAEFEAADKALQRRLAEKPLVALYDYDNDRRFQQWKKDRERVMERLRIHWIDEAMYRPTTCLIYMLRIFTTAGLFYGTGRTLYLYRTMDRVYAKLNGVTLGGLALQEVSLAVAKGGAVALAATAGVISGEALLNVVLALTSDDPAAPPRSWRQVTAAGAGAGLFSAGAFGAMHFRTFRPRFLAGIAALSTAAGGAAGLFLGRRVYQPFADGREHEVYDPYWVPWYKRAMSADITTRTSRYL